MRYIIIFSYIVTSIIFSGWIIVVIGITTVFREFSSLSFPFSNENVKGISCGIVVRRRNSEVEAEEATVFEFSLLTFIPSVVSAFLFLTKDFFTFFMIIVMLFAMLFSF